MYNETVVKRVDRVVLVVAVLTSAVLLSWGMSANQVADASTPNPSTTLTPTSNTNSYDVTSEGGTLKKD